MENAPEENGIAVEPSVLEPSPMPAPATNARSYPPQTPRFYLQLSVYWFAVSLLWGGMITIVMQSLIEQMVGKQKDLYLGYTLALGALVSTLICLIMGTVSDQSRWKMGKRRPYIIIGSICAVPILLWLPYVPTIGLLMLNFCLLQLWVNIGTAPYAALVPDLVPKQRQGTASAYLGLGSLTGTLGGLLLCGTLMPFPNGLRLIMIILSIVLVVAMLFTVWRIKEESAEHNEPATSNLHTTLLHSFKIDPREHRDFFWLIASRFAINTGFYTATEFLYYYVKDTLHAPNPVTTVTQLFVLTTFSGLLGNFPAGILSDRVSKKLVVYISNAITGLAALIFLLTSSIPVAFVAAFVFGAGYGAFQAVDWALATNLLPDKDEAKYMGVWHSAFTVPQVIAPIIGGVIAYLFNQTIGQGFGYRAVLFMVLIYLVIGTLLIKPIRERTLEKLTGDEPILS